MIKHELEFKKNSVILSYILLVLSCSFFYAVLTFKPIGVFDVDYIYVFYCLILLIVAFLDAMNSYIIKNYKERLKIKSEAIQLLIGELEEPNLASQPELDESEVAIEYSEKEVVEVCLDTKEPQFTLEKEQRMMVIRQKLFEQLIESKLYLNVDLTLQKLSEVLEVDKKELSEYFKESNSVSFRQYINRLRVEYAVGLIKEKNKDVTVEELTSFCGFNTRLSFYRAFVQVYGFPPSALLSK
ncbi:helix-turn-helix domain-containing protein [Myroides profundi]|nr:AraC family transcriptional regulator [Myroides profundi]